MSNLRPRLLLPLLAVGLLAGACSGATTSSSSSSGPSAAASAAPSSAAASVAPSSAAPSAAAPSSAGSPSSGSTGMCDDLAALKSSVAALKDLKLLQVGTAGVKTALADVQSKAEALKASARATLAQPVVDLLTALAAFQASVTSLGDQSSLGAAAVSIKTSIDKVAAAAATVQTAMATDCPSS